MTADERKTLIAQYNDGYRVVAEALVGATDEQLDARPEPGKWTAREVVHHLADSEMTGAARLRLLVATDNPQILGYDQDQFARKLFYDRPIAASLDAFKAARRATAEILERMTDADWARAAGTHTQQGPYTADRWLAIYAPHAHAHAEQILVARGSANRQ
ncbi:MAG: DinB superfamily protein [Acidobacteria bacterium]|nr:DinB superfamily protein [Acidobacteriota bacterium]